MLAELIKIPRKSTKTGISKDSNWPFSFDEILFSIFYADFPASFSTKSHIDIAEIPENSLRWNWYNFAPVHRID